MRIFLSQLFVKWPKFDSFRMERWSSKRPVPHHIFLIIKKKMEVFIWEHKKNVIKTERHFCCSRLVCLLKLPLYFSSLYFIFSTALQGSLATSIKNQQLKKPTSADAPTAQEMIHFGKTNNILRAVSLI